MVCCLRLRRRAAAAAIVVTLAVAVLTAAGGIATAAGLFDPATATEMRAAPLSAGTMRDSLRGPGNNRSLRDRLVSLIDPGNRRSIRVAEKLGARPAERIELLGKPAIVYDHPR